MNNWLYPISERAGRRFVDFRTNRSVPVSYENFRDYVISGRVKDRIWYLATGFRAMEQGDRVWIYLGDRDIGVIGVATAMSIDLPSSRTKAAVHLRWDIEESLRLIAHPVAASIVRNYVHYPRRPALRLDNHRALLRQFSQQPAKQAASERAALKPLRLKPVRSLLVARESKHYRALLDHDSLLGAIARSLQRSGYGVGLLDTGSTQVDLAALKGRRIVIVEAKKISSPTGRSEGRAAFAQLHEYRWKIALRYRDPPKFVLWAAFSRRPVTEVVEFLEDAGIAVSWKGPNVAFNSSSGSKTAISKLMSRVEL
jgi:hypothetical protein